jgi:general secretion pathway protein G
MQPAPLPYAPRTAPIIPVRAIVYPSLLATFLTILLSPLIYHMLDPYTHCDGRQSRITTAQTDISTMKCALDAFQVDTGRYPTPAESLNALVTPPPNTPNWHGPYLEEVRPDPWGTPYDYTLDPATSRPHLRSNGPDHLPFTPDDVTN